ncbi:MAG: hypothetical protein H0W72_02440 [Planctomycetes bacterium]|nr:hypothetical protein [Planctomycetota bacterium]
MPDLLSPRVAIAARRPGPPEMAGNAFCPSLVKVGERYFLWHNDESYHGGLHLWEISGVDTIVEQVITP